MTHKPSMSRVVVRRLLPLASLLLTSAACRTTPPKTPTCNPQDLSGCIIEEVDVLGNEEVPDSAIKDRIATAESAHPLGGILQGIPIAGLSDVLAVEYERFDRFVLERDLTRVERYYQTRGFYDARVTAGRVTSAASGRRQSTQARSTFRSRTGLPSVTTISTRSLPSDLRRMTRPAVTWAS